MKKFFLSTVMALACIGANAQVETTPVTIGDAYIYGIPDRYCYDRDEYLVAEIYEGDDAVGTKLCVYDKDLKLVKEIKSAEEIKSLFYTEVTNPSHCFLPLTQTLFNDDEKFEYIVAIPSEESYYTKGIKIISDDGKVLQTLTFETNMLTHDECMELIKIGGNLYLGFEAPESEGNTMNLYKINKSSDPSKVSIATAPVRIKVSPRVAERGQDITVAAEGEGVREVVVTDAAGRVVYRTKADAGQQTVKINSQRLSSGLNVVSVKNADGKSENCKVIVKK